ncbi:MAG: sigma 54-interacting transcriptional regulator [Bacillota bacterium]
MKDKLIKEITGLNIGIVQLTPGFKVKWFNQEAGNLFMAGNVSEFENFISSSRGSGKLKTGSIFTLPCDDGDQQVIGSMVNANQDHVLLLFSESAVATLALFNREGVSNQVEKYYAYHNQGDDSVVPSLNPLVKQMVANCLKVASINTTVLITGESGVGKEVLARTIHRAGDRSSGEMLCINCGCIPENLLEAELFGYEEGAFTGARKGGKVGLFQIAQGGTIFLDEIGELPSPMQVKLLRAIHDKQVFPIGSPVPVAIDVRIIAATNKDLKQLVREGLFREDLYYRLNVIPIHVPPLRERKEDIAPLANFFIKKYSLQFGLQKSFTPEAIDLLKNYSWPGNIRQLENIIQRAIIFSDSFVIDSDQIEKLLLSENMELAGISNMNNMLPLTDVLDQAERDALIRAKTSCKTTRQMAELLKISQASVIRKMKKHFL